MRPRRGTAIVWEKPELDASVRGGQILAPARRSLVNAFGLVLQSSIEDLERGAVVLYRPMAAREIGREEGGQVAVVGEADVLAICEP